MARPSGSLRRFDPAGVLWTEVPRPHEDPGLPQAGAYQDARLTSARRRVDQEDNIKFEITATTPTRSKRRCGVKDAAQAEVVVASIGPERVTQALRTALGMGADRAVHVKDAAVDGSDSLGIAKLLAAVAKEVARPRADGPHVGRRQRRPSVRRCSPS